jgi:hypothetical protein
VAFFATADENAQRLRGISEANGRGQETDESDLLHITRSQMALSWAESWTLGNLSLLGG